MTTETKYSRIKKEIGTTINLIVVSKYRSIPEILSIYNQGQRVFAENRVQALLERKENLPNDIEWHLIGHLQSNKVKYIAPFIHCIQSVDSLKILNEIQKHAKLFNRKIEVLLQVKVAKEESKFGFSLNDLQDLLATYKASDFDHIIVKGIMGMGTMTPDIDITKQEFEELATIFKQLKTTFFSTNTAFNTLSMGMSNDYMIAKSCGSTMLRIGSAIFE
jgi:pyridoxal phosphate enzyme (YggS family)